MALLKSMVTAEATKRASAVDLFKVIKPKVGKRVPHMVQTIASNFKDEYEASEDDDDDDDEFDDEVITKVSVGAGVVREA